MLPFLKTWCLCWDRRKQWPTWKVSTVPAAISRALDAVSRRRCPTCSYWNTPREKQFTCLIHQRQGRVEPDNKILTFITNVASWTPRFTRSILACEATFKLAAWTHSLKIFVTGRLDGHISGQVGKMLHLFQHFRLCRLLVVTRHVIPSTVELGAIVLGHNQVSLSAFWKRIARKLVIELFWYENNKTPSRSLINSSGGLLTLSDMCKNSWNVANYSTKSLLSVFQLLPQVRQGTSFANEAAM